MSDWKEFSAKTVNEALEVALKELGATKDQVDYEVTSEEKAGLLGLFSKPAVIRVKLKDDLNSLDASSVSQISNLSDKDDKQGDSISEQTTFTNESSASNDEEALVGVAEHFLSEMFKAMKMDIRLEISYEEDNIMNIELFGDNMGPLIGKRGTTLDSIQYLTSLVVNREADAYVKVKIDTENFRERRRETLENLAKNIAHKAKRTHRPVYLEPMNPYERRVIHSTLQDDELVETYSKGEEPYRKVVVTLKDGVDTGYDYRGSYGRGRYNKGGRYHKRYSGSYRERSYRYDEEGSEYRENQMSRDEQDQSEE